MKKVVNIILLVFLFMIIGIGGVSAAKCSDYTTKNKCKAAKDPSCLWNSEYEMCYAKDCSDYKSETKCITSYDPSCVWNSEYKFCSATGLVYVACGLEKTNYSDICKGSKKSVGTGTYDIPPKIPKLTSFVVNALKIITPVILIFIGMITMIKAIASSNEDEIKKAQGSLVKKIIIAAMIFFVVAITQFVIGKVSDASEGSFNDCMDCFLNGNCPIKYYRTGASGSKCVKISK